MSITSGDGCLAYVFLIILWVRHEEAYGGFDCILKRFFFLSALVPYLCPFPVYNREGCIFNPI